MKKKKIHISRSCDSRYVSCGVLCVTESALDDLDLNDFGVSALERSLESSSALPSVGVMLGIWKHEHTQNYRHANICLTSNIMYMYIKIISFSLGLQEVASFRVLPQWTSQALLAAPLLLAHLHHLPQSGRMLHHSSLLICPNLANQRAASWDHLIAL